MKKVIFTACFIGASALSTYPLLADTSHMFKAIDKVCPNHKVVRELQKINEQSKQNHQFPENDITWVVAMESNAGLVDKLVNDQSHINLTNDAITITCVYGNKAGKEPVTLTFSLGEPQS